MGQAKLCWLLLVVVIKLPEEEPLFLLIIFSIFSIIDLVLGPPVDTTIHCISDRGGERGPEEGELLKEEGILGREGPGAWPCGGGASLMPVRERPVAASFRGVGEGQRQGGGGGDC